MIKSIEDTIMLCDDYCSYLKERGLSLTARGFPIFRSEWFIKDYPDQIVPFYQRNNKLIVDKRRTLICLFSDDENIYRRLDKAYSDIYIYRSFMGVASADVTVTADMDQEYQNFVMLLNQLYTAVLAINGIPICMSTRRGMTDTIQNFEGVPKEAAYISSFLGCNVPDVRDMTYISKILTLQPGLLILYGKENNVACNQLDNMGIDYRQIPDFHTFSKRSIRNGS